MGDKAAVYPDLPVGEALKAVARDVLAEAREALGHDRTDAIAVHEGTIPKLMSGRRLAG